MTREEYLGELNKLYTIAVKQQDVSIALHILGMRYAELRESTPPLPFHTTGDVVIDTGGHAVG